ncbi:hypothetical protein WJX72_002098 [[Myrmecia] bisecta]|uniref:Uncharacterized protein n=1 Tax=[Myrmecia] bisecta TaxID=41462 RepID=A0AAW1P587_9CHLO
MPQEGVTSRARAATAEARRSDDADPSCSSTTLSAEEYGALLDAAMRYPDQQVGLCVAAMMSVSLTAGFRSDDLQDTRYFLELVASVPAEPLAMQVLAIAHNGGKANQDGQTTHYAHPSREDQDHSPDALQRPGRPGGCSMQHGRDVSVGQVGCWRWRHWQKLLAKLNPFCTW